MSSRTRHGPLDVTRNLETVHRYLDGFRTDDHDQILSCLTDDVRWTVWGSFRLVGKTAYEAAIDGPEYVGPPELGVVRVVDDGDTIMAELEGRVPRPDGSTLRLSMAELFLLRDGLICERRAWVLPFDLPEGANPGDLEYFNR